MPAAEVDLFGFHDPARGAVGVEHGVTGHHFVAAVAVEIDRQGLMGRTVSAGLGDGPQQLPVVVERPDLSVAGFDHHVGRPGIAGEVGEHQAIAGVFRQRQATARFARGAVQLDQVFLGAEHDLVAAVAVPIVDLTSNVVVQLLSGRRSDRPIARAPTRRSRWATAVLV